MSDDKEQRILSMFDKSSPKEEDLFETSYVNHIAWSMLASCTLPSSKRSPCGSVAVATSW